MASNTTETTTDHQSTPPTLEELARRGARSILLPFIIGYASSSAATSDGPREVSIIVNPRTGSLTMIEGAADVRAFLRGKEGRLPASKASIAAMPVVKVSEQGLDCAICLSEFGVGDEAKQMPCKHRFHSGCIEKWLGIQGSCPVCRYRMPLEGDKKNNIIGFVSGGSNNNGSDGEAEEAAVEDEDEDEEEEEEEGDGDEGIRRMPAFVFHIYFVPRRLIRGNSGSGSELDSGEGSDSDDNDDENSGSTMDADGSSTDMEVDSGSLTEEMDIDGNNS